MNVLEQVSLMTEGLKYTGECACVDGCLTVGPWGDSCEYALHHGACDCCEIHVIYVCCNHARWQNIHVKLTVIEYTNRIYCIGVKIVTHTHLFKNCWMF